MDTRVEMKLRDGTDTQFSNGTRIFQLALLAVAMAAGGYARTAITPLQEAIRVSLILSDNQIGIMQGPIIGIPVAVVAIPLGLLIDRISRARLLFVFLGVSWAATVTTAYAWNFPMLLLSRCIAGVTCLGAIPVIFSLMADLYKPNERGRALTVISIGQIAGNSAAFALGGSLIGNPTFGELSWRTSMLWMAVPLVLAVLALLMLDEPVRKESVSRETATRQLWTELRGHRAAIGVVLAGINLVELSIGAILIWASPMLARNHGATPAEVGLIMATGMMVSGVLGPVLGGAAADIAQSIGGPRATIMVLSCFSVLAVPASFFGIVPDLTAASILLAVALTLMLVAAVAGVATFTIVVPKSLCSFCMPLLVASNVVASLGIAPLTVSLLSGAMGGVFMVGKALSAICVISNIAAAAIFIFGRKSLPPKV